MEKVWDAYEAVSGAQGRCTASKQLAKKRGNMIQRSAHQYDLYLRRSEDGVTIDKVEERVKVHPYVAKLTTIKRPRGTGVGDFAGTWQGWWGTWQGWWARQWTNQEWQQQWRECKAANGAAGSAASGASETNL